MPLDVGRFRQIIGAGREENEVRNLRERFHDFGRFRFRQVLQHLEAGDQIKPFVGWERKGLRRASKKRVRLETIFPRGSPLPAELNAVGFDTDLSEGLDQKAVGPTQDNHGKRRKGVLDLLGDLAPSIHPDFLISQTWVPGLVGESLGMLPIIRSSGYLGIFHAPLAFWGDSTRLDGITPL
jgi:hypothetical protein